ncbi:MAG: cation:proton antiporter [Lentisphaeria bacterium]
MSQESLPLAQQIAILAVQIGVIIFASRIFGVLAKKCKIPSVLGELVVGILIGPYLLGSLALPFKGFADGLFPLLNATPPISPLLYSLATIGSIVLLFMSGLETDLRLFFRYSIAGTLVGVGGIIVSYVFGIGVGVVLLHYGVMDPRSMFLGILSTATSVGITARILSEKHCMGSPEGVTILAAAVIDDVLGIICLAVVVGMVAATGSGAAAGIQWSQIGFIAVKSFGIWLGVTGVGLLLAYRIANGLKKVHNSANISILALAMALVLAGLFEQAGLAMIIGAYVMGLSLSKTDVSFKIRNSLESVYAFFVPIFFVVMGMMVDVRVLGDMNVLKLGLIYSALAILAKIIGCAMPSLFMNFNLTGALRIGTGMIPRGEVALIVAGIGATTHMTLANGDVIPILNSDLFGVAIIMTMITTLVSPPLLSFMLSIKKKGIRKEVADSSTIVTNFLFPSDVIADFVLKDLLNNLRKEGYFSSQLDKENRIVQFRNNAKTMSLSYTDDEFIFSSNLQDVTFIRLMVHESIVSLYQSLKSMAGAFKPEALGNIIVTDNSDELIPETEKTMNGVPFLSENGIIMNLASDNVKGLFKEMVEVINANKCLQDMNICLDDVYSREKLNSTYLGNGVALPHGRTLGTKRLSAAIGISQKGIVFDDNPEHVAHIVILCLCSKDISGPYLQFIASVAKILMQEENRTTILNAKIPRQIIELLKNPK